jgi:hypothetical protein
MRILRLRQETRESECAGCTMKGKNSRGKGVCRSPSEETEKSRRTESELGRPASQDLHWRTRYREGERGVATRLPAEAHATRLYGTGLVPPKSLSLHSDRRKPRSSGNRDAYAVERL